MVFINIKIIFNLSLSLSLDRSIDRLNILFLKKKKLTKSIYRVAFSSILIGSRDVCAIITEMTLTFVTNIYCCRNWKLKFAAYTSRIYLGKLLGLLGLTFMLGVYFQWKTTYVFQDDVKWLFSVHYPQSTPQHGVALMSHDDDSYLSFYMHEVKRWPHVGYLNSSELDLP